MAELKPIRMTGPNGTEVRLTVSALNADLKKAQYWLDNQVMTDMISAMRVLTDTANTGAVAISLPQDVQAEAYDYPVDFFRKRVWRVDRRIPTKYSVEKAVEVIKNAKKPLLICGGGVRYAEAHKVFRKFAEDFGIAFGETQAGKSTIEWTHELNLGGLGTTGGTLIMSLIFGHFGAPVMGVRGAAVATVISRFVEAVLVVAYMLIKKDRFSYVKGLFKSFCKVC